MAEIVKRKDKVPYFGVLGGNGDYTFYRMKGFTAASVNRSPIEYSRQYIDEEFERSDIVGYSMSIDYEFDMFSQNPVHEEISSISENEVCGSDAVRPVISVDFSKPVGDGYKAIKRDFSVISSKDGEGFGAYVYSGSLKSNGKKVFGTCFSSDNFETVTFTED